MRLRSPARLCLAPLLATLAGTGCNPSDTPQSEDGDTGAPQEDPPEFLEPPGGELNVFVSRVDDVQLALDAVELGRTRVVVDTESLGALGAPHPFGALSADVLDIAFAGAMIGGTHVMQLRTRSGEAALHSEEILVTTLAEAVPAFEARMLDEVLFEVDAIETSGLGDEGLLLGVDVSSDPPTLHLVRALDTGWDLDSEQRVSLPSLTQDAPQRHTAAASVTAAMAPAGPDDAPRLRVAWRAGDEGQTIVGIDAAWPPTTASTQAAVSVGDDWVGDAEYATLGRPILQGDTLIVEALVATDVELRHPGDRTLVTARIEGVPGQFVAAQRSAVGKGRDVDLLSPAKDLLAARAGRPPGISARADGVRPIVLEVDPLNGTLSERPSASANRYGVLQDAAGPLQTVLGGFSSRQVFAPLSGDSPGVFFQHLGDAVDGASSNAAPGDEQLGELGDVTGPIASTVVAGFAVFLIPQGIDAPLVAISSGSDTPSVQRLDAVACDAVAVPTTEASGVSRTVALACLRGREVVLAELEVTDPAS